MNSNVAKKIGRNGEYAKHLHRNPENVMLANE